MDSSRKANGSDRAANGEKGLRCRQAKTVGGGPIIHSENRTKRPPYCMVVNVDVNVAKDQIAGMLAKTEAGAGFVHIPSGPGGAPIRGFDQHVIEEFTAESCTVRMVNGSSSTPGTRLPIGATNGSTVWCMPWLL